MITWDCTIFRLESLLGASCPFCSVLGLLSLLPLMCLLSPHFLLYCLYLSIYFYCSVTIVGLVKNPQIHNNVVLASGWNWKCKSESAFCIIDSKWRPSHHLFKSPHFVKKSLDRFVLKIQLIEEQEQEESCEEISEGNCAKLFQFQGFLKIIPNEKLSYGSISEKGPSTAQIPSS